MRDPIVFAGGVAPDMQTFSGQSWGNGSQRRLADIAAPEAGTGGLSVGTPNLCLAPQETVGFAVNGWSEAGFFIAAGIAADPFQGDLTQTSESVAAAVAPSGITLSNRQAIVENAAGAVVGTLRAVDADPGDTHTFTVNDSRFEVVGNVLKLKDNIRLDFEVDAQVSVQVTATDAGGSSFTRNFNLGVADVDEVRFAAFGDFGDGPGTPDVAALIAAMNVDFIVTTGDNAYSSSASADEQIGFAYSDYIGNYTGAYGPGSDINRFFPSLGNHDYGNLGVDEYLDYFTLPGNERYYDYQMGAVHFFVVNSNSEEPDGRTSTSAQAQWLQAALAASDSAINIVYFHHAAWSSARHGSNEEMQWPFEEWGATAVLTGHDHTYERVLRDDNADGTDLPYFVTGLGGNSIYDFDPPVDGSEVRYNDDYGTMLIQATDTTMTFEFWSIANGGTLIDSYTIDLPGANPLLADGDDTMRGGDGDDFINGLSGNDRLRGRLGDDLLIGGEGNDVIFWDPGNDTINGGSGVDRADYSSKSRGITVDGATGTITQGAETDRIVLVEVLTLTDSADQVQGGGGLVRVLAGAGNDVIHIGATAMVVFGAEGMDTVTGGGAADVIRGGVGHDFLDGAGGNDTIAGGKGNDLILGGTGADHFLYGDADGTDVISDFEDGVDRIDLTGLGLGFGSLAITSYDGGLGTRIAFGSTVIKLADVTPTEVSAADFIF